MSEREKSEREKMDVQRSQPDRRNLYLQPDLQQTEDLETLAVLVRKIAQHCQGHSLKLLALLRLLEALHQEVRDDLFQKSLPDNRQALYALLRDIEADGGWPYIHRMKLQAFLANLEAELESEPVLGSTHTAPNLE
jgi:hypothetical protein